jgi:integrase
MSSNPRRQHPDRALTAVRIRNLKKAGRYADGNGLYLVIDTSGAKRWLLRLVVHKRRRDLGLGGLRLVSLAEARATAIEYRKLARAGGDPMAEKKRVQREIPDFAEAARKVHASHSGGWKNKKHSDQWINTLTLYVVPHFGTKRVDLVDTADVLQALLPIWLTKPETARRVKQRIGTVLDWATASGFRSGVNPIAGVAKGLPKQSDRDEHFRALPYLEVPALVNRLRLSNQYDLSGLALEFLILTATRTSEVLNARWPEIDLKAGLWVIPASRMKAGQEHRIPLSARAREILERARELAPAGNLVFPGRTAMKPMSNMVFLMALRRMKIDATTHGFRSSFRDWASERTNFSREVCEMALAHTIKSKAEAAYRRGDLLDKRRQLMKTWAKFLEMSAGNVVPIRA